MTKSDRAAFLSLILEQMHSPYRWGGKGERPDSNGPRVFDCSGLVTSCYFETGGADWRATHNTDSLLAQLATVLESDLKAGDLVLYGKNGDASHVMVYVGEGVVAGASGGDHTTLTLADAYAQRARVQTRPSVNYRSDVLGFRRLPFADEAANKPKPSLGAPALTAPASPA
ncbi:C40 family peptidase [Corallococcus sp. M34]|uniref:NlpC/P60 family protein n=1 Tax=Citreicoccus inhibens TaxID=2849499 RepID=UPI001C2200BB|nr:NlpC/P60 family protein [Citreicoccus inhibens]MBU8900927.1 C40 family peptidase [Citreicoccus inhibens]